MEQNFKSKRILVTGAGSGMGRCIALNLSKHGAHVIAISILQTELDALKHEDNSITTVQCDVGNWNKTQEIVEALGDIDALVNNAGVPLSGGLLTVTEDKFDDVYRVNVKAVLSISQVVAKNMIKRKYPGVIVNISSQCGVSPMSRALIYSSSKAAVVNITKSLAAELGPHGIRVNSVAPTVCSTKFLLASLNVPTDVSNPLVTYYKEKIPLKRILEVDDVMRTVLYLLSDSASMVNGITLLLDGGYLAAASDRP